MKGSFILSLSLDVLAIAVLLIPSPWLARLSRNTTRVTYFKRACFAVLLLSGYLVDRYITHGGS